MNGWVKIDRDLLDSPIWADKSEYTRRDAWIELLLLASFTTRKVVTKTNEVITLKRGQLLTSYIKMAEKWHWDRRKVRRYIDTLTDFGMVQHTEHTYGTVITIVEYSVLGFDGTADGTADGTCDGTAHGTPDGTADGTRIKKGRKEEGKNVKKDKTIVEQPPEISPQRKTSLPTGEEPAQRKTSLPMQDDAQRKTSLPTQDATAEIVDYLNSKTGKHFSTRSKDTRQHIAARLKEGYTVADFKRIVDVKTKEWLGDEKMDRYLCPSTLFASSHFEAYLNQRTKEEAQHETEKKRESVADRYKRLYGI